MLRLDINLAFTALNLLIWYLLIRKFLFKPVNQVISSREEAIKSRYEEAQRLQEEAKAEKDKCRALQAGIEEEKDKVSAEAQKRGRAEYEQIVKDAQKKAEQIVEASKKEAELEKEKIVGRAEREIRALVMDAAVKSMESSDSDGALYDQFLTKAGEAHAEN